MMKKLYTFLMFLVVGLSAKAAPAGLEDDRRHAYGEAFIFMEGGVEFAVFPDGQFDFYYNPRFRRNRFSIVTPHVNISYNAGFDYGPYVQYDDFGAVIQIENVPVFYDFYGRIIRAGNVHISYNHFGMIHRIGKLFLHYDPYNRITHYSGYINARNPYYVYRPWHNYYRRPYSSAAVVYYEPYRAHYYPNRLKFSHYRNYYRKHYDRDFRRRYYSPGEAVTSFYRGRRTEAPRKIRRLESSDDDQQRYRERSYLHRDRVTSRDYEARSRSHRGNSRMNRPERQFEKQQRAERRAPAARSRRYELPQHQAEKASERSPVSAGTSGNSRSRSSRGRN